MTRCLAKYEMRRQSLISLCTCRLPSVSNLGLKLPLPPAAPSLPPPWLVRLGGLPIPFLQAMVLCTDLEPFFLLLGKVFHTGNWFQIKVEKLPLKILKNRTRKYSLFLASPSHTNTW